MRVIYTLILAVLVAGLTPNWAPIGASALAAGAKKAAVGKIGPSGLAVPRFESLTSAKVNLRAGPGLRYPISWVYLRRGLPVMVVAEFEYWRKVRDVDGAEGWLHKSLIRGRRTAIIIGETRNLYESPGTDAPVVAKAEAGVLAQLLACKGRWCLLEANNLQGWLPRDQFFGAFNDEVFD
jgi:SH3-like domain-containing protein